MAHQPLVDDDGLWTCRACRTRNRSDRTECWQCHTPSPAETLTEPSGPLPSSLVRTYRGKEDEAAAAFQRDAARLAELGYRPTSQTWAPGSYGCGAFLVAALLVVVFLGILVLIYLLMVRPPGVLTVTYTLAEATPYGIEPPSAAPTPLPGPPTMAPALADQLRQLAAARDAGLVTQAEYDAKRAELLTRF